MVLLCPGEGPGEAWASVRVGGGPRSPGDEEQLGAVYGRTGL